MASLVAFASLSNCSTGLLHTNTLNLATTIDDLAIRQIVFNLTRIRGNEWALPSQVQISSGQVSARTNVAPSIAAPLDSALTGTTQLAKEFVAATGALTTTTTTINTADRPNVGAGISGTVEDVENWNVVPVQDPDQLRRLRLVYQYGAHQITAKDLLCHYPIPEIPEKAETKSDLQILADALKAAAAPDMSDKPPVTSRAYNKPVASQDADKKKQKKKRVYIRGEFEYLCVNIAFAPSRPVKWILIGTNPDPAFLTPPGCVLCAYPNKEFAARFKFGDKIYESRTSDDTIDVDPDQYQYVPVVVNDSLIPISHEKYHYRERQGFINWLFVVRDGEEAPPEGGRRIGSSNGYTVYTTHEQNFSEFALAVTEATLQSPELQKSVSPPPPLVQTNPTP
jgi:hypothetical protein